MWNSAKVYLWALPSSLNDEYPHCNCLVLTNGIFAIVWWRRYKTQMSSIKNTLPLKKNCMAYSEVESLCLISQIQMLQKKLDFVLIRHQKKQVCECVCFLRIANMPAYLRMKNNMRLHRLQVGVSSVHFGRSHCLCQLTALLLMQFLESKDKVQH